MENYENLRLEEKDKIKKMNVFQRIFTKDSQISSEDLEFLEEYENHSKNIKDAQEKSEIDTLYLQQQNANISLKIEEKEEILEELVKNSEGEIPFKMVSFVFLLMFFVLALFVPKIYIRNNIYFTSRNIIQLQAQLDSLNEENRHIKKQLEDIKFKNLTHELDF
ncbi:hypothetical protein LS72_004260 [Helicobacter apodemus]|uniref:Uncharacterized protein n=1 Tax=Helicobacter apodemus TaxID=135569 RepID=A0A2U8FD20_9HELI|nr:hypothetical protein [Helicobacter apodemus]AWI34036.1 hypothetical protein CDV25_04050 [Helicobacter apodemus]TLE16124.1 hypothetical protein LS72_004260 [Helicobacter apodemus]